MIAASIIAGRALQPLKLLLRASSSEDRSFPRELLRRQAAIAKSAS